jgi:phage terminase small subunit
MASLRNPRHEKFAQELAAGKTADAAYIAAGYKENRGNAARLSADKAIRGRMAELQSAGAERAVITVESLIREAEDARVKAMAEKSGASAAVQAITAKAKLSGFWVDKRALTDPRGQVPARYLISERPMTEEEWIRERATVIDVTGLNEEDGA